MYMYMYMYMYTCTVNEHVNATHCTLYTCIILLLNQLHVCIYMYIHVHEKLYLNKVTLRMLQRSARVSRWLTWMSTGLSTSYRV